MYGNISSSGWYRTYVVENHRAYGYYGEFVIATAYNNSTNTVLKFSLLVTHSKVEIHMIDHIGPTDVIDKIRVMRTSDENRYMIDIHYALNNLNYVVFQLSHELRGNVMSGNSFYNAGSYSPVADSPSGESLIATANVGSE